MKGIRLIEAKEIAPIHLRPGDHLTVSWLDFRGTFTAAAYCTVVGCAMALYPNGMKEPWALLAGKSLVWSGPLNGYATTHPIPKEFF